MRTPSLVVQKWICCSIFSNELFAQSAIQLTAICCRLSFTDEPLLRLLVGGCLNALLATQSCVFCQIDLTHPARAELIENSVVRDCLGDHPDLRLLVASDASPRLL